MEFTSQLNFGTGASRCAKVATGVRASQSHQRMAAPVDETDLHELQASMPPYESNMKNGFRAHQVANSAAFHQGVPEREEWGASYGCEAPVTVAPPPPGLEHLGKVSQCCQFQELPSRGSFGHPYYCGAPCKYARRKARCREGFACLSCHICKWTRKTHGLRGWERLAAEEPDVNEVNNIESEDRKKSKEGIGDFPMPQYRNASVSKGIDSTAVKADFFRLPKDNENLSGCQSVSTDTTLTNVLRQWPMDMDGTEAPKSDNCSIQYYLMQQDAAKDRMQFNYNNIIELSL